MADAKLTDTAIRKAKRAAGETVGWWRPLARRRRSRRHPCRAVRALNERADLSPEMAIRLEKAFGILMEALMRMQNSFDIEEARKRARGIMVAPYRGKA